MAVKTKTFENLKNSFSLFRVPEEEVQQFHHHLFLSDFSKKLPRFNFLKKFLADILSEL